MQLGDQNPVQHQQSIIVFILKKLNKEFVWIEYNSIPNWGGVQNPIMQKCLFLFVLTVFSGGRWIMGGGVHIYIDIYI